MRVERAPLPSPHISLPVHGGAYERPSDEDIDALREISSATACGILHALGLRQSSIVGPRSLRPGTRIVGSALTLQWMPQREDFGLGVGQEEVEKKTAIWAVLDAVRPGDVLTMQAFGDPYTGCMGEILATYFKKRGGQGMVVDGYVRDWPRLQELDIPIWAHGTTPNFGTQAGLIPWGYEVPIACGTVLVLPGDIIIADDDGAVLVPARVARTVAEKAAEVQEAEHFSKMRLAEGGKLTRYYPLDEAGVREFEEWKTAKLERELAPES